MATKDIVIDGISYTSGYANMPEAAFIEKFAKFCEKHGKFSRLKPEQVAEKLKAHYKLIKEAAGVNPAPAVVSEPQVNKKKEAGGN